MYEERDHSNCQTPGFEAVRSWLERGRAVEYQLLSIHKTKCKMQNKNVTLQIRTGALFY